MRLHVATVLVVLIGWIECCTAQMMIADTAINPDYLLWDSLSGGGDRNEAAGNNREMLTYKDSKTFDALNHINFDYKDRLKRHNGGRQRPMLSIMNDVDVLRQRLLKNVLAREFEKKKQANLDLMNMIGKRRKRNTNSSAPSPVEQLSYV